MAAQSSLRPTLLADTQIVGFRLTNKLGLATGSVSNFCG